MESVNEEKVRITLRLPKSLVDDFDKISSSKGYQRRNEAIQDLITEMLKMIEQIY